MVVGGCSNIKVGILGGIGPEATAEFYSKLIKELQIKGLIKENKDYPQIIINSINAPELVGGEITEEQLEHYIQGLRELDSLNLDFIMMICNTIHLYFDYLQDKIKTPIINLKNLVKSYLEKNKISSVLVLGTKNTLLRGLYKFEGIKHTIPNEEEQNILENCIANFNRGYKKEEQIQNTLNICNKYLTKGSGRVILGCTEFAVMLKDEQIPKINTMDILLSYLTNFSSKLRLIERRLEVK